jgi:hypothetical protein
MKTLHNDDFIEFKILPYIIGGYAALGLLVFFLKRKVFFRLYVALFLVIALLSLADFYRWEYNYGHDLDPNARYSAWNGIPTSTDWEAGNCSISVHFHFLTQGDSYLLRVVFYS